MFSKTNNFARLLSTYFFILLIALSGCVQREIANLDSAGENILCFGDSITFGYGAGPNGDYPAALSKMLDIPVVNLGIDGDTSVEGLKRLKSDVLDRKPLLVIIEFGGNDFLRKISLEETVKSVEEMVRQVVMRKAMVAIADVGTGMIMGDYSREFKRLSKKYRTIFIPALLNGIITNPSLKSDFLHPNADGYKLIAQRIHRVISPYLNQNSLARKARN